ncbi:MAG TPA: MerR family transcriptional regulator [Candidatus Eisenbacteria bacterium]|nr:MerR family transcriptional regulator [Candidatus Eisenbacteria bacterium]
MSSAIPAAEAAATDDVSPAALDAEEPLLRIQAVAEDVGLTPRSIRYYEEIGLLKPAARSEGDYRLYDADDIERLRFIKGLRDDAGFSLAEIGQLLEDERARARISARFRETQDPSERRQLVVDGLARIDRQIETLRRKIDRLASMITAAELRRRHLNDHLAETDARDLSDARGQSDAGAQTASRDHTAAGDAPAEGSRRVSKASR